MTPVRPVGAHPVTEWTILPDGTREPGRVVMSACGDCFFGKPHECRAPRVIYLKAGVTE